MPGTPKLQDLANAAQGVNTNPAFRPFDNRLQAPAAASGPPRGGPMRPPSAYIQSLYPDDPLRALSIIEKLQQAGQFENRGNLQ